MLVLGAPVKCSFCGKRRHQVTGLAAAARVAICSECPALCREIIVQAGTRWSASHFPRVRRLVVDRAERALGRVVEVCVLKNGRDCEGEGSLLPLPRNG
jgi:putative hemolysin